MGISGIVAKAGIVKKGILPPLFYLKTSEAKTNI